MQKYVVRTIKCPECIEDEHGFLKSILYMTRAINEETNKVENCYRCSKCGYTIFFSSPEIEQIKTQFAVRLYRGKRKSKMDFMSFPTKFTGSKQWVEL